MSLDGQENLVCPCADGLSNRLQFRCRRLLVAKEVSLLDDRRSFFGQHVFPSWRSGLDLIQDVARENVHNCSVISHDWCDVMIFQQVRIQVSQMHLDLEIDSIDPDIGRRRMEGCAT